MRKQNGFLCSLALVAAGTVATDLARADTGKLLLTGGVSTVEGAAGGGISPWAVIGSNATADEVGASVNISRLKTRDYGLSTYGAALGLHDRVELSVGEQDFNAAPAVALNGLGFSVANGQHIKMTVLGAKVKVAGDAVLDSDTLMPQIAVGLEYKSTDAGTIRPVLDFLHARTTGTDLYASATKLLLAQGVLLNATLRYTNANQGGLLGFGSAAPGRDSRSLQPEFSVAYLLSRQLVVGAEYRFMPNNLEALGRAAGLGNALHQDNWKDLFVAWAPSKNFSVTAAYVDLGQVVPGVTSNRRQSGLYLSTQWAF
ncbi:MAG: DUF3034 family protein [Curvibacter sp.]|nr:DUF3034 family protein [Curvibacter sp.]